MRTPTVTILDNGHIGVNIKSDISEVLRFNINREDYTDNNGVLYVTITYKDDPVMYRGHVLIGNDDTLAAVTINGTRYIFNNYIILNGNSTYDELMVKIFKQHITDRHKLLNLVKSIDINDIIFKSSMPMIEYSNVRNNIIILIPDKLNSYIESVCNDYSDDTYVYIVNHMKTMFDSENIEFTKKDISITVDGYVLDCTIDTTIEGYDISLNGIIPLDVELHDIPKHINTLLSNGIMSLLDMVLAKYSSCKDSDNHIKIEYNLKWIEDTISKYPRLKTVLEPLYNVNEFFSIIISTSNNIRYVDIDTGIKEDMEDTIFTILRYLGFKFPKIVYEEVSVYTNDDHVVVDINFEGCVYEVNIDSDHVDVLINSNGTDRLAFLPPCSNINSIKDGVLLQVTDDLHDLDILTYIPKDLTEYTKVLTTFDAITVLIKRTGIASGSLYRLLKIDNDIDYIYVNDTRYR